MYFKVTTERLVKARFKLEKCEDGRFWVLEQEPGAEADRMVRACGKALENLDTDEVRELILLQCGSDFSDPALYIDGFMWPLSKRDFANIVFLLKKR